jgi:geranylgeranyl pyrophosphate synthase
MLMCRTGSDLARGQEMDLCGRPGQWEEDDLLACYRLKTGALFAAAAGGAAISGGAGQGDVDALYEFGMDLGLCYQYLDDAADGDGSPASAGQDDHRCTAAKLLGADGARRRAREFIKRGVSRLARFGARADRLRWVARRIARARN